MVGHWKIKRSDGSSADVHWSKLRADADFLLGEWEESDGAKLTEIRGWCPSQQVVSAQMFGAHGQYASVSFNKVSAQKMSGRVRLFKPNGKLTMRSIEIQRVNENLAKVKLVDSADGSVVTSTVTRIKAAD